MNKKQTSKLQIINYTEGKSLIVRLRGKRLSNNTISLYLDYYKGYTMVEGKMKTHRQIEYLKKYLIGNPKTDEEREKNNEVLKLAHEIRNQRESDINHNEVGLVAPFKKKTNFFDFCTAYIESYQKKDIRMIKLAVNVFKEYNKQSFLTPLQIDQKRIYDFKEYLLKRYNGETPNSIFARFKKVLTAATNEGLLIKNPAEKITCKIPTGIPKEILCPDEVILLSKTDCPNTEVKRAFLFSLSTGLRFVDIKDLQYKHVLSGKLKKQQQKTGREVVIDLNNSAIKLIGELKNPDEYVFNLPSFTGCLKSIKSWAKKAGINRNITWHSARHSFATMLLINNVDIKTVGNLLGHSKLEHTQKYTHVIDELKKNAVNKLPNIEL